MLAMLCMLCTLCARCVHAEMLYKLCTGCAHAACAMRSAGALGARREQQTAGITLARRVHSTVWPTYVPLAAPECRAEHPFNLSPHQPPTLLSPPLTRPPCCCPRPRPRPPTRRSACGRSGASSRSRGRWRTRSTLLWTAGLWERPESLASFFCGLGLLPQGRRSRLPVLGRALFFSVGVESCNPRDAAGGLLFGRALSFSGGGRESQQPQGRCGRLLVWGASFCGTACCVGRLLVWRCWCNCVYRAVLGGLCWHGPCCGALLGRQRVAQGGAGGHCTEGSLPRAAQPPLPASLTSAIPHPSARALPAPPTLCLLRTFCSSPGARGALLCPCPLCTLAMLSPLSLSLP